MSVKGEESDDSMENSCSSLGRTAMRLTEIKEFLEWSPKNVDKLRVEPVPTTDNEYDQLVWISKCIEVNLDQPLKLKKFIIPEKHGGLPFPKLDDIERYIEELKSDAIYQSKLENITEELEDANEELEEKNALLVALNNELNEVDKEISKLERSMASTLQPDDASQGDEDFEIVSHKKKKKAKGKVRSVAREEVEPPSTGLRNAQVRRDQLMMEIKKAKSERRIIRFDKQRFEDRREKLDASVNETAYSTWKVDKKAFQNWQLAYNALGEQITKCIQLLGTKCRIKAILEDGSLNGNRNPLINGEWRIIYGNILERLYPDSVDMMVVFVTEMLTDMPQPNESFELFFFRMMERARILVERAVPNMSWREMASIAALRTNKSLMHNYLDWERKRTLQEKDAAIARGENYDSTRERSRWVNRMAEFVKSHSEGARNEKKINMKASSNVTTSPAPNFSTGNPTSKALQAVAEENATAAITTEKKNSKCINFIKYGKCRYGSSCKCLHPSPDEVERLRKLLLENDMGYWIQNETSVKSSSETKSLLWDSCASNHYTGMQSQLELQKTILPTKSTVSGLGGKKEIIGTYDGTKFGLTTHVNVVDGLDADTTLLSLGTQNKVNIDGEEGITILRSEGGIRAHIPPELSAELDNFIDKIDATGKIEGRSVLASNNIYEELRDIVIDDAEAQDYDLGDTFCEMDAGCYVAVETTTTEVTKKCKNRKGSRQRVKPTRFYNRQVKLDSPEEAVRLLSDCGISGSVLKAGVRNNSIAGIPVDVSMRVIDDFFHNSGPDIHSLMASGTTVALDSDAKSDPSVIVGETLILDAVDPPYNKLPNARTFSSKSVAGYKDCVIAMDEASGFITALGRKSKANPEIVVDNLIDIWWTKHRQLKHVKADDEFILKDDIAVLDGSTIFIHQPPPNDHRRVTHSVESALRWIQELGQKQMNRLYDLVRQGWITESQWVKLWYHATLYAIKIWNLSPSNSNASITRYEHWHGIKPDLQTMVLLPFGTLIMTRRGTVGSFGRSTPGIYIGASPTVPGGIMIYNPRKSSVLQSGSFVPKAYVPRPTDYPSGAVVAKYYGDLIIDPAPLPSAGSEGGLTDRGNEDEIQLGNEFGAHEDRGNEDEIQVGNEFGAHEDCIWVLFEESVVIPPMPLLPRNRRKALNTEKVWQDALAREIAKLVDAGTFRNLKDGKAMKNCIKLRLLPVLEYKWKLCPKLGIYRWVESVRLVANGKDDKRSNERYASTPHRIVILIVLNSMGILKLFDLQSDAIRAYLQAKPMPTSEEIIIEIPEYVRKNSDLPAEASVATALYGMTDAALAFELFVEEQLKKCGFNTKDIAQSVYVKEITDGIMRMVRHSDDFLLTGSTANMIANEMKEIGQHIQMTPPQPIKKFLGLEVMRYDVDGKPTINGQIVVLKMTLKIQEMYMKFQYLCSEYNPTGKVRKLPGPKEIVKETFPNNDVMGEILSEEIHAVFRSLMGCIMWIVNAYRWDAKFACFISTLHMHMPRRWDMFILVWLMEYLWNTIDTPLVLGGSNLEILVYSDASFATLPEARSPKAHLVKLNDISGAILCEVHCVTIAVKSVYEAELIACSEGMDSVQFILNVLEDLRLDNGMIPQVRTDSESVVSWLNGKGVNVNSRHLRPKYYGMRHAIRNGEVEVTHIDGTENPADLLTKILSYDLHMKHGRSILGHGLVNFEMVGVFKTGDGAVVSIE